MKKNDPLTQLIPLKIEIVNDVTNGKLNLNPNGTFWYNPNSNEFKKIHFLIGLLVILGSLTK